ncbi:oxygen-insensitive NAD(P)H nitroreductase [Candidatus Tokpelaia sp.]|uniref:oxygen-insensitive NAD(P)H nitroreductase n=1 Tax=Candidatus Tokpelaia sp. TaxID=2233777 RepID=UPI00123BE3D7|nr:oxygen-insensitive NAD(P)H nitroreductase [Candidatus Tokpelaia sp.]KAA6405205.1 oxygen-insensitive NAD(P)H nitroreductase [Candidatus Tokpelaia sp.]
MKDIVEIARKRYTTKHYNPDKKLTPEQMGAIKELLRLAPSSVNSQPWHFIIAATPKSKARIAKAMEGLFAFNKTRVLDAAAVVIFCARTQMDDSYLQHLTDKEREDGRFSGNEEIEEAGYKGRKFFVDIHRKTLKDLPEWAARQTYLNIGAFLLGAAAMGLDATPIEGFDPAILEQEFGFAKQHLAGICLAAVGHRAAHDGNATRPKSRLDPAELFTEI